MSPAQERRVLAALLFGNFVTGTGILLPAGMLGDLAHGFDVSLPRAGLLLLVSGVVVALGAPLAAAFTSAVDRRWLLAASMLLYAVCHMASALAPNFAVLLAVRLVLAIPAAIFTPQAAATVGALLPAKRRGSAITVIFIGWSLATVGGMPLGGYVAHTLGWQVAFLIVAALSIVALLGVWLTVPRSFKIAPLNVASWRRVLTSQALMTVLLVTVLNGTGQFTFFTYLAPSLKASLSDNAELLTIVLAWYGTVATLGNVLVTRAVQRIGAPRSALFAFLVMSAGLIVWGAAATSLWAVLAGATLWGLGTFAANSVQQARLAGIAPELTSASIALNTSAIYFGQAAGAGIGGTLIYVGLMLELPFVAAAILLVAVAASLVAQQWER